MPTATVPDPRAGAWPSHRLDEDTFESDGGDLSQLSIASFARQRQWPHPEDPADAGSAGRGVGSAW
jgi:hypothetical protein